MTTEITLNTFAGDYQKRNTYSTKAEFTETMRQLHGDSVKYIDMQGNVKPAEELSEGRLYVDGVYVGFWGR